jgi:HPt (histidine-containing phosphotransfer) domain-containing protein
MSDAFDEKALLEHIEDDIEFLEETVAMLDEDSPALLEEVRSAAAAGDAAALVKPAHALKSMVGNFCAGPAQAAARKVEIMGREGQLADADQAVQELEAEVARLLEELTAFVRTRTP